MMNFDDITRENIKNIIQSGHNVLIIHIEY